MLFIARNLYAKYEERRNIQQAFYADLCGIYIDLIKSSYEHAIPLSYIWHIADSRHMLRCACDVRGKKIAKLSFVSPRLAYRYMEDKLPDIWRRLINRFV